MKKKSIDMINGNLWIEIPRFAFPAIISGILQILFNTVDMIVVGKFSSSESMAAISSTTSLINLLTNFFIGLSVGSGVCLANKLGEKDYKKAADVIQTSIAISIISGFFLMLVGTVWSKMILLYMKTPENVIDLSNGYLKSYFIGMPAIMVYNFSSAILRAKGDSRRPLNSLVISGILNVLLDMFFIIVVRLDVVGAGLASSISFYVSALIILISLSHDGNQTHLDIRHLYVDWDSMKDIAKIGIPAGIQSTLIQISNVTIQSSINEFGSIVIAGDGAAASVMNYVCQIMHSFHLACISFSGQSIGAGKINRIKDILWVCLVYVTVFGIVSGYGSWFFGNTILRAYSNSPEVISAGMVRLYIAGRIYFIYGIMEVFVGSTRAMGKSFLPTIVSLFGICAIRLLWVLTWFRVHHTIEDLYYSYPISWVVTAIMQMVIFFLTFDNTRLKN